MTDKFQIQLLDTNTVYMNGEEGPYCWKTMSLPMTGEEVANALRGYWSRDPDLRIRIVRAKEKK